MSQTNMFASSTYIMFLYLTNVPIGAILPLEAGAEAPDHLNRYEVLTDE